MTDTRNAQADLARDLSATCRLTGRFVLRSGRIADEYFDKYRFEADPVLLDRVAAGLAELVPPGTQVLAGLELGGIPVVTALARHVGLPCAFVRKTAKAYGTARLAEGAEVAGRRVLVVEDVVTSGGQVVISTGQLRELGAQVDHALRDRPRGGRRGGAGGARDRVACPGHPRRPGRRPLAGQRVRSRAGRPGTRWTPCRARPVRCQVARRGDRPTGDSEREETGMAHGEAEHGCAQDEPCRPGHHEQPASAKHPRRTGVAHPAEPPAGRAAERGDEDPPAPRQRAAEPLLPAVPEPVSGQGCRSDLPGWAGAHQHGAVRPRSRAVRRERPPRRWC